MQGLCARQQEGSARLSATQYVRAGCLGVLTSFSLGAANLSGVSSRSHIIDSPRLFTNA